MKRVTDYIKSTVFKRSAFFVVFLLTLLPLIYFPIESFIFHRIHQSPRVEDGVLNLSGYDFYNDHHSIPLNGKWEFFWNQWIVTDKEQNIMPDNMIEVPGSWSGTKIDGIELSKKGYASYRLRVINCPDDVSLICYVPNLGAAYKVFVNNMLVAASGIPTKNLGESSVSLRLQRERLNVDLLKDKDANIVIEISSDYMGGLYLVPILAENMADTRISDIKIIIASAFIGILLITLICYSYIMLSGDISLHSFALLAMDLLVFLRILVKDEFFGILKIVVPFFRYHVVNFIIQILTIFLPVIFLICVRDLVHIKISKKQIIGIFIFEAFVCVPLFYCLMNGFVVLQFYISLLSAIPFVPVFVKLYHSVKEETPFALTVSMIMMLILSSLLVASLNNSGIVLVNISMFPSTLFLISVILQDYFYIKRNSNIQKEALEAANLRLQLREKETSIMLSQIKPHFLYNALIAIQVLCTKEPELAEMAIIKFSKYLRMNMASINSSEPILFETELEHVKNYVYIEKLRFKDRLKVVYEIGCNNFRLPPLTIQPLVENAIKHGVCKKIVGGTVILRTYETPKSYHVEVIDDGVGFDVETIYSLESKSYGLKNISFRLKQLIDAQIYFKSEKEKGTSVFITIYKQEGEK